MATLRDFVSGVGNKLGSAWNTVKDKASSLPQIVSKNPVQNKNYNTPNLNTQGVQNTISYAKNSLGSMVKATTPMVKAAAPVAQSALNSAGKGITSLAQKAAPVAQQAGKSLRGVVTDWLNTNKTQLDPRASKQIQLDQQKAEQQKKLKEATYLKNLIMNGSGGKGTNVEEWNRRYGDVLPWPTNTPTPTPVPQKTTKPVLGAKTTNTGPTSKRQYEPEIKTAFGDFADEAHNVLSRVENGRLVGENTTYRSGKEIDIANRIDPKTGKWSNTAPVMKVRNAVTGEMMDSVDRGLFRINNGTFFDYMNRFPKEMKSAGINKWDDMLDPALNAKMARIILAKQGWGAWYAAPTELRKQKRK